MTKEWGKHFPVGQDLLPAEIKEQLPGLYENEEYGLRAKAMVKFFTPDSNWTCAVRRRK